MMIDGAHEGAFATHPTIAERVAAIISVTGSMALIAPARRDTRPPELRAARRFRPPAGAGASKQHFCVRVRQGAGAALARVSSGDEFNRLGLTREMTVGAVAAIGVFLWVHSADLGKPSALAEAFDPAPMRTFFAMGGEGLRCQMQGIGWLIGLARDADRLRRNDRQDARRRIAARAISSARWRASATAQAGQWPVHAARRNLQQRRAAGCPARRGAERALLPDRPLLRGRPRSPRGDGAAAGRRHDLPPPLPGPERRCRAARDARPPLPSATPPFSTISNPARRSAEVIHRFFGDPGLQVAGSALCRSRAPGRHCAAARAAHRSRLRIGAERRWSGRNSSFWPQLRRTSSPAPPAGRKRLKPAIVPHRAAV